MTVLEEISIFLATIVPGLVSSGHDLQLDLSEHGPGSNFAVCIGVRQVEISICLSTQRRPVPVEEGGMFESWKSVKFASSACSHQPDAQRGSSLRSLAYVYAAQG